MNIHEFQAKEILSRYGIATLPGFCADTVEKAQEVAQKIDTSLWVVKAQIHAGGRGKAGGVILSRSIADVGKSAHSLLGKHLVTHQTDSRGQLIKTVYIESGCDIAKEFYVSLCVNRAHACISMMVSTEGGVDIETVAEQTPEKIVVENIDPVTGLMAFQIRKMMNHLALDPTVQKEFADILNKLYQIFCDLDADLIEINPLVLTTQGRWCALDAKISFEDAALYRHPELHKYYDQDELDPLEAEAKEFDLNYVKLEGNIGCMVNGAGLAMATMDIIKLNGGKPANFLDVGGGADQDKVKAAFQIILKDSNIKSILVNIFGGIMRCDVIANGIIAAAKDISLSLPTVVRLEGTNKDLGIKLLTESGLSLITAANLEDAAIQVTNVSKN